MKRTAIILASASALALGGIAAPARAEAGGYAPTYYGGCASAYCGPTYYYIGPAYYGGCTTATTYYDGYPPGAVLIRILGL
jgi:hypothetical protein